MIYSTYYGVVGSRGSAPSAELVAAIAVNTDASAKWLLTGEGDMLRSHQDTTAVPGGADPHSDEGPGIDALAGRITKLKAQLTNLEKQRGIFADDPEVVAAVSGLDQTDYNTIRDLILGFAWWARRYGSQERGHDETEKKQPARV